MQAYIPLAVIISGLCVALYFIIRSGAKAEVKADIIAEQDKQLIEAIKKSNEIENKNNGLSDADLAARVSSITRD